MLIYLEFGYPFGSEELTADRLTKLAVVPAFILFRLEIGEL
jgi:hypothetical protein